MAFNCNTQFVCKQTSTALCCHENKYDLEIVVTHENYTNYMKILIEFGKPYRLTIASADSKPCSYITKSLLSPLPIKLNRMM